MTDQPQCPHAAARRPSRRGFLAGAAGAGAGAAATMTAALAPGLPAVADTTAASAGNPASDTATDGGAAASYAFHGAHQAGITTPAQRSAAFVALDVTAASRSELRDLLRTITERSRFLTRGGQPTDVGITAPPSDSGVLGPDVPADGLTVTTSVGASLFDDRYGIADRKPARLRTMEDFPNDALDRAICDGDLLLQVCANNTDTVVHALRDVTRATRGAMQVRWRQDGFVSPPRPSGTPRNLLGFKDGTANPSTSDRTAMDDLVWTRAGRIEDGVVEPDWVTGGSYHVVRTIRMLVEFWDRVSLHEQETMIGRHRDSGAPLTRTHEFDDPDYADDPTGDVIQLDAHIRLANPRTAAAKRQQMLRRPYNYDAGTDANGNLDMGLLFTCFQADLERQFVTVQKRLADEPLVDYISPVGGGYFFALPGVRHADDWLGRPLLS
ncbi:deferrochelatase/peroxidase EfeB [Curtobacterium sp. MCBD17_013]|uniref:iron uptake transporter deferrochelatase/peroxidase subunit n=1 Tax=unclassified Curtobacterium TaxID=257496 RepID=UPI000DA8298E|nr:MULTISPECIES: iron uptake transporter deferrochelatase/peroxidase subunit [unclassified Curtobacterium]PZF63827.1 deferrochelatase/peroxidase EfeB [Curtobacterium sp. MCBD17_013]WIB63918.1 iron uptake transporter deferrochelatase/peroxidase subunit [Curtobacterium sp. MCBD17_040]